jgi:deoxyribose-phosphate aldolase
MSLESSFNAWLPSMVSDTQLSSVCTTELIRCLDLTLLTLDATPDELLTLKQAAISHDVAAICVYPHQLHYFRAISPVKLATVINFPEGNHSMDECLNQIEAAISLEVNEIDYVIDYTNYLAGNKQIVLDKYRQINQLCKNNHLTLKVILETGALSTMNLIYELSSELIALGCDFLKTSTGKIDQGASLSAVFAMLSAIKDSKSHCGIKISGGIKLPSIARQYSILAETVLDRKINSEWFRIGASSLLNELLK